MTVSAFLCACSLLEGEEALSEAVVRVKHVIWENSMNLEIFENQV
jgi:hypothetical protein